VSVAAAPQRRRVAAAPGSRPLRALSEAALRECFDVALRAADGLAGAHCLHEWIMRGEMAANVEPRRDALWARAAATLPDWLPMRHVEWLPQLHDVCARFRATKRGSYNLYLVLLDYSDSRAEPHGIYVGMTQYPPAQRFDQHKAGIRHAGSVLQRGLELLTGPVAHLQRISRAEAARIEVELAEVLAAEGFFVQGGH
jgi:hypothetical protein